MGLIWCRERVEQAQNSKSPVDRILVCCSNLIKPKSPYSHSQGKIVNDFVYRGMRNKNVGISHPVPIRAVPPRNRNKIHKASDWHTCSLSVPELGSDLKPPVPPPRKKRKKIVNSAEVLNNHLPELHSPSCVIHSENLLHNKYEYVEGNETNERDVLRPLEKFYVKEKTTGYERHGKISGNRTKKIKKESHPNDKRIKNDNERKAEQKIKHVSTVSLPNYNELVKPARKVSTDVENGDDKSENQSVGLKNPRRNSSTISLPGEGSNSILSSLSEATIHRLETYMKRCRSFGSLKPQQLLEKLEEFNKTHRSASESSDSWSGLDDWDLGIIEYCDPENSNPPLTPKSTLPPKSVSFFTPTKKDEEDNNKEEPEEAVQELSPKQEAKNDRPTPIVQRCESLIEGVPLEWFLDPNLRRPAIMPPPSIEEPKESTKTPPPSPDGETQTKNQTNNSEVHSSLLTILRQYKEDENGEPEIHVNIKEIVVEKDPLTFEEIDLSNLPLPPKPELNLFTPTKNRSNSLTEEESKLIQQKRTKPRSPSIGLLDTSNNVLEQLRRNSDKIEKEIRLNPNELLKNLRRESMCQSLPEDAFEAFVNKRKPSMKESFNEFSGFEKEKKPDEEKEYIREEKKNEENEVKVAPHLPLNPPPIVINPPPGEVTSPAPYSLVKPNENNSNGK